MAVSRGLLPVADLCPGPSVTDRCVDSEALRQSPGLTKECTPQRAPWHGAWQDSKFQRQYVSYNVLLSLQRSTGPMPPMPSSPQTLEQNKKSNTFKLPDFAPKTSNRSKLLMLSMQYMHVYIYYIYVYMCTYMTMIHSARRPHSRAFASSWSASSLRSGTSLQNTGILKGRNPK